MTDFVPHESAQTIREPSTANLMIDSEDRINPSTSNPFDFIINKPMSIMNGYFRRVVVSEVVLNWYEPNIVAGVNNTITLNSSTSTLPEGNYTIANALDRIVSDLSGAVPGLKVVNIGGQITLNATSAFTITAGVLQAQLQITTASSAAHPVAEYAYLMNYRYIDFVSSQLTNNQYVKDATTNLYDKNVLCRWYMAWDNPTQYDKYNFPIAMGYLPFNCRRLFSPAKQINWLANQPIGQLGFQVYPDPSFYSNAGEVLVSENNYTNWLMTLQVSEV